MSPVSTVPHFQPILRVHVADHVQTLFRHPAIRESATTADTLLHSTITGLSHAPLFLHPLPPLSRTERNNFTSWMRVLPVRTSSDEPMHPAQADLRLFHEMVHMASMTYAFFDHATWTGKVLTNEAHAILTGDVVIFFDIPGLRAMLPPDELWVDRLLTDRLQLDSTQANASLYRADPNRFYNLAMGHLLSVKSRPWSRLDPQERPYAEFFRLNEGWCRLYRGYAPLVERRMVEFMTEAHVSEEVAIERHLAWLADHAIEGVLLNDAATAYAETLPDSY